MILKTEIIGDKTDNLSPVFLDEVSLLLYFIRICFFPIFTPSKPLYRMQIFQRNILNKYIEGLDNTLIDERYKTFTGFFLDPERQANILNSKEEQFQEGFLRELFVKILGYTLNPDPNFNLTTEKKNETNSKKADGAILVDGKVVGVIELNDHKTPDLSKVEAQAFNYKSQHKEAVYVVISNFEKLRFYIDNAVDFEEFDLFHLTRDDFARLWICLAYENIAKNLPKQIKAASLTNEDQITNALYKDYSNFKRDLFEDILKNNPTDDTEHKILLFKKTQKLLDRLLFIFFAEDRGLLPPNSIMLIINQWEKLKDLDEYQAFYNRLKKYFGYMNTGFQGKNYEVFAYNGGLFKPDEILDGLVISDEVLMRYCKKISDYDFQSDVDVNILGHIFENSLTEIEEITTKLQQGEAPTISKRKKDGVFYTPQYITKYIVENTVGKLCREKKAELGIDESEYFADKKRQMATKKALIEKLDAYRNWLLQISICDPACGSGAFLNAALNFLIAEHKLIDEMQAKVEGASLVFPNVENSILENNLYGVDINEESVEIAKLSLWLRTAKPHRKLNSLNDNIKCGNSLIDDPAIAGDKAFNWQTEFPKVFEKGGFDVVIGNPPYVQLQAMGEMSDAYAQCGYQSYNKSADLYCLFTERGYNLLKPNGLQSFIMPNKWMLVSYGKELRSFLAKTDLQQILNFGDIQFFDDAATIVCIFVTRKSTNKSAEVLALSLNQKTYHGDFTSEVPSQLSSYPSEIFGEAEWSIQPKAHFDILKKMQQGTALKDLPISINYGIKTGFNDAFFIDGATRNRLIAEDPKSAELIKPLLRGRDIQPWMPEWDEQYLIGTLPALQLTIEDYPAIKNHLLSFTIERLEQSGAKGARKKTQNKWFETQDTIAYYQEFSKPKIMYPNMTSLFPFIFDDKGYYGNDKTFMITAADDSVDLRFLTAIFNSKLCKLWIWYNCPELLGGTREIRKVYFENFRIPSCSNQQAFAEKTDLQMQQVSALQQKRQRFLHRLEESLGVQKITAALERFDEADFAALLAELKKQKISLTLVQKDEWEDYFTQYKADCNALTAQIAATDKEIDRMVYQLYGLTEDEISIIEKD